MDEWSFVGELEHEGWKGPRICQTFYHFTYGVDAHCRTLLACNIRRKQLQQGQHLTKTCKLWIPHFHEQPGWEETESGANQGIKKKATKPPSGGVRSQTL